MYGSMYVCMYVCMSVCVYVCMHACMYVCMHIYIVYTYILCLHGLWIRRCHACGRWVLSRGGVGVAVTPQALLGLRVLGFRGLGVWRLVF